MCILVCLPAQYHREPNLMGADGMAHVNVQLWFVVLSPAQVVQAI